MGSQTGILMAPIPPLLCFDTLTLGLVGSAQGGHYASGTVAVE